MISQQRFSYREALKLLDPQNPPEGRPRASDGNDASQDWDLGLGYDGSYKTSQIRMARGSEAFQSHVAVDGPCFHASHGLGILGDGSRG